MLAWTRGKLAVLALTRRGRGRPAGGGRRGYALGVRRPMDMPFLTYLALKGLRNVDLDHCDEVVVVPDACGTRNPAGLADAISAAGMRDVRLLPVSARQRAVIGALGQDPGLADWTMIAEAIDCTDSDWIFLHDTYAIFTEAGLVEANYALCRARECLALGVTARWDPDFVRLGVKLAGTWEMMFSTQWARRWRAVGHLHGLRKTQCGPGLFDSMLYPQFRDFSSGGIQVRESNSFLHLSGVGTTYRRFVGVRER